MVELQVSNADRISAYYWKISLREIFLFVIFRFFLVFRKGAPARFLAFTRFLRGGIVPLVVDGDVNSSEKACERFFPSATPLIIPLVFFSPVRKRDLPTSFAVGRITFRKMDDRTDPKPRPL